MSNHRQKFQQRFSSKFSSSLNIIARDFVLALFEVRKNMIFAKRIDSRHFEKIDIEKSFQLIDKRKSTIRQFLKNAKVLQFSKNFTQKQIINHIFKRQNDFAI